MKKYIQFTKIKFFITSKCPYECPICGALDSMTIIDGECYCLECGSFID